MGGLNDGGRVIVGAVTAFDDLASVPPQQLWAGYLARAVHGEQLTLAVVEIEPGGASGAPPRQRAARAGAPGGAQLPCRSRGADGRPGWDLADRLRDTALGDRGSRGRRRRGRLLPAAGRLARSRPRRRARPCGRDSALAPAEDRARAVGAVERERRPLAGERIVDPVRLPAPGGDAAHARALRAREHVHLAARGSISSHGLHDRAMRAGAVLPEGVDRGSEGEGVGAAGCRQPWCGAPTPPPGRLGHGR